RPDLPERFHLLLDVSTLTVEDMVEILSYIAKGPVAVSEEVVQDALRPLEPSRKEEIMASFGQGYFERGEAKGLAEGEARGLAKGEARGEAKGEAKALIRLLTKRFGPPPLGLQQRIATADVACLEAWFDRAIDASDLPSVFGTWGRG